MNYNFTKLDQFDETFSLEEEGRIINPEIMANGSIETPLFLSLSPTSDSGLISLQTREKHNRVATLSATLVIMIEVKNRVRKTIEDLYARSAFFEISDLDGELISGKRATSRVNYYFSLDMKGCGFVHPENFQSKKDGYFKGYFRGIDKEVITVDSEEYEWKYQVLGLFDSRVIESLIENCELINNHGGRAEEVIKVFYLEEIFYQGKKTSIIELQKRKVIPEDFSPVMVLRASRTPHRIKDLWEAKEPGRQKEMMQDVFEILNKENELLGIDEKFCLETPESIKSYLLQFCYQIGRNLGVLQKLGKIMVYFNTGNITLALGEIVDLDSIADYDSEEDGAIPDDIYGIPKSVLKDIRDSLFALNRLIKVFEKIFPFLKHDDTLRDSLFESFNRGYQDFYQGKIKKLKNFKKDDIKKTVESIASIILINNQRVAPINFELQIRSNQ